MICLHALLLMTVLGTLNQSIGTPAGRPRHCWGSCGSAGPGRRESPLPQGTVPARLLPAPGRGTQPRWRARWSGPAGSRDACGGRASARACPGPAAEHAEAQHARRARASASCPVSISLKYVIMAIMGNKGIIIETPDVIIDNNEFIITQFRQL